MPFDNAQESHLAPKQAGQSRRHSVIESVVSALARYVCTIIMQITLLPLWGIHLHVLDNVTMGLAFTAVGTVLGYVLRRGFNWWHLRTAASS